MAFRSESFREHLPVQPTQKDKLRLLSDPKEAVRLIEQTLIEHHIDADKSLATGILEKLDIHAIRTDGEISLRKLFVAVPEFGRLTLEEAIRLLDAIKPHLEEREEVKRIKEMLQTFLQDAFSSEDLNTIISRVPNHDKIQGNLPSHRGISKREYMSSVVQVYAEGEDSRFLFNSMRNSRSFRVNEINQIESAWKEVFSS